MNRQNHALRSMAFRFDRSAERCMFRHPVVGFVGIFVAVPLVILACVCLAAAVVALPMYYFSL